MKFKGQIKVIGFSAGYILYEYWPIPHINYAFTACESSTTEPHSPQHTVM